MKEFTGSVRIPQVRRERFKFWLWYNQGIWSKYLSSVALLTEKIVHAGDVSDKSVPISFHIRYTWCRRMAERRGQCELERTIITVDRIFSSMKTIALSRNDDQRSLQITHVGFGEFGKNVFEDLLEDEVVPGVETQIKLDPFHSNLPKKFIRCDADDRELK